MDGLKQIIKERKIKIYRLAKDLNVPRSTIRSWLTGSIPRKNHLILLINYFHAKPEYLVFGNKEYAPTLRDEIMRIVEDLEEYAAINPEGLNNLKQIIDLYIHRDVVFSKKKEIKAGKRVRYKAG